MYASCVRSSMTYGSETRPLLVDVGLKFKRAEIQMIRWMCGVSMKDRRTSVELRRLVGVEPITSDEDGVKKCMEFWSSRQKTSWKTKKDIIKEYIRGCDRT